LNYWKRATFWSKVKDSIQGVLAITQLSLIIGDAQHIYNLITFAGQVCGLLIPIWFDDRNSDGIVDLFEGTTVTTVTVNAPKSADVSIDTETTKPATP
jgi:hypothetical protein